jgi:hypothetical protein
MVEEGSLLVEHARTVYYFLNTTCKEVFSPQKKNKSTITHHPLHQTDATLF